MSRPVVASGELLAQQHGGVAHGLLDDPGALDHRRYELEHAGAPLLSLLVITS